MNEAVLPVIVTCPLDVEKSAALETSQYNTVPSAILSVVTVYVTDCPSSIAVVPPLIEIPNAGNLSA